MTRHAALTALAVVVLASPVVAWWLVGDLSEEQGEDYIVQSPDLPMSIDVAVVAIAVLLLLSGAFMLWSPAGRRHVGRAELTAAAPLVFLGLFVGAGGRVLTARVGGANIGGGMLMIAASVVVPSLLIWRAARWSRITHTPR